MSSFSSQPSSSGGNHGCGNNPLLDAKIAEVGLLRRMIQMKSINISADMAGQAEYLQRILKGIKKEAKEKKLGEVQTNIMFQGLYEDVGDLFRECTWKFRSDKTDFQSLFIKLKLCDEGKNLKILEEIINLHDRKPPELLLNCNLSVLSEQRNSIQSFTVSTLCEKATQLLKGLPYYSQISSKISNSLISTLVEKIAKNYKIVPYHNFTHGFGVFLSFYALNTQIQDLAGRLSAPDLFFACVACLAHDIQHNGNNTLFEAKTSSDLGVTYGHFSVMQRMHLSKTMDLLDRDPETNGLFQIMDAKQKMQARKIITKAILATDMARHYELLERIRNVKEKKQQSDNQLIIEVLTHACDIENPSLDYQSYLSWAQLVCIQFHDQTVKQQQWNVEVTEFLKFDSLIYFYKNQLSFASTIVLPLWINIGLVFPEIEEKGQVERIRKNIGVLTEGIRRNSDSFSQKPIERYLRSRLIN